jgi:hypothetical protein
MAKWIRTTGDKQPRIIDTSPKQPAIDPAHVAAALGAEPTGLTVEAGGSPLGLASRAMEYGKRAEAEVARRQSISVSDAQWKQLDDLAAALSSNGSVPVPGQVASAVLRIALRSLVNASEEQRAALAQEIAALTNGNPSDANPAKKDS